MSIGNNVDMDPQFGNWLAGFIDGEGCFHIKKNKPAHAAYSCEFTLQVRADELPILVEIRERTGFGSVLQHRGRQTSKPAARWSVTGRDGCAHLIDVLDIFPLRAKKRADYALWREAVLVWNSRTRGRGRREGDDAIWERMEQLQTALRAVREYRAPVSLRAVEA